MNDVKPLTGMPKPPARDWTVLALMALVLVLVWLKPRKPGVVGSWFLIAYAFMRSSARWVFRSSSGAISTYGYQTLFMPISAAAFVAKPASPSVNEDACDLPLSSRPKTIGSVPPGNGNVTGPQPYSGSGVTGSAGLGG